MSAFTTAKTVLTDMSAIKKALVGMGWREDQIEVHDKPVKLVGYHQNESKVAQIVIRKQNLGGWGAFNDLGFLQQVDGTIQVIGENAGRYGNITSDKFKNTLTQEYALVKLQEEAEAAGFFIDRVERKDGQIYVTAENPYL